jgi:dTDP-glucose 4,6-dehydratase
VSILVTGGAGFIGSNFVLQWLSQSNEHLVNLDKLTYAGNPMTLASVMHDPRHTFVHGDICDRTLVHSLLLKHRPRAIVNFAAESHVDRSIHSPGEFLKTNVEGTFSLLEAARHYYSQLNSEERNAFRFHHVSTDEVYGSLAASAPAFTESKAYEPNSPYAASKAASDHLVRAWFKTYGLPVLLTNCSNNYGPYQFPEKLIPFMITSALAGRALPIYGDGLNVRDWLYVTDHCDALRAVLERGTPGSIYNIGGSSEKTNLEVVTAICEIMDELAPNPEGSYRRLMSFVADRPGHDRRYAVDASKIRSELGWSPKETFGSGLRKTVTWYLENREWTEQVQTGEYRDWIKRNYDNR